MRSTTSLRRGERRGRRHRVPRRGRGRLGHRRPAAVARATSACSCSRTRSRPAPALVALILAFGLDLGRALQPGRHARRPDPRRDVDARDAASTSSRRSSGACVGAMVANLMFDLPRSRSRRTPLVGGPVARRGRRHVRAAARHPRRRARRPSRAAAVRRRRVHRRRVLVHVVDELRQPRGHHRPHADRHLRRHRARRRPRLRRAADRRRASLPSPCSGSGARTSTPTDLVVPHEHRARDQESE